MIKLKRMSLQNERQAACFICNTLKNNCKIIKNQDSDDAICMQDFIKLLTEDTNDYPHLCSGADALYAWYNIDSKGVFPV